LPAETLGYLRSRLHEILSCQDTTGRFEHLTRTDRTAIRKLLQEWKPTLLAMGHR